jgi:hypothetical protein
VNSVGLRQIVKSFEISLMSGTKYLNGYATGARYSGTLNGNVLSLETKTDYRLMLETALLLMYFSSGYS